MKSSKEITEHLSAVLPKQKAHQIVKSAPIVVKDDPTLMFIKRRDEPV